MQLLIEEFSSGGQTAVMLKRLHDRTTRWMSDREKHWLQYTHFLVDVVIRTLRAMVGNRQEADNAFGWFEHEGSVDDTSGSILQAREYTPSRLMEYLRVSEPDQYKELQEKGGKAMDDSA